MPPSGVTIYEQDEEQVLMQEEHNDLSELLQRYLDGKCGPEEEKFIRTWYDSLGANREPFPLDRKETSELQHRLWQNIRSHSPGLPMGGNGERPLRKWHIYLSGTAAILLFFVAFFFYRTGTEPVANGAPAEPAIYHKTNKSSKTILVVLQDESMVWLRPSGSIHYKDFSGSSRREVTLKGEAYFEVAKHPEKPFLVHSGNVVTRVTGTKFHVKAYETEHIVEVEVTEGTVEVSGQTGGEAVKPEANLKLAARQKAVYHTGSRKLEKLSMIPSQLHPVEQISQQLAFEFNDTPLRKVIDLLEEAYPISIELENKLLEACPLTASLNNETLDIKLELICRSIGASFSRSSGKIMISGEGCIP